MITEAPPGPTRVGAGWIAGGVAAVVGASLLSLSVGAVDIAPVDVARELLDRLPGVSVDSGLSEVQAAIVWEVRTPRVVLGLLVGALLAASGAAYQGVFRNPLADPFLLGISAGAGLGATIAIVTGVGAGLAVVDPLPLFAFIGALTAVSIAAFLGTRRSDGGSPATLILAGVAVAAFFAALQTYVQQRDADSLRQVYSWILGRLATQGWDEVLLVLPYAVVTLTVLLLAVGLLDVLSVGDDEAASLGVRPDRIRLVVLVAASLAAAAAVSVSGLIGFVGLIVPHAVRMVVGVGNRIVLPLSILFGAAFLVLADLLARTVESPAELPIGVVTAFFGAPFFLVILRHRTAVMA
ncbi:MAG: iron ABC transporter permease [Actinomycetota bacterium]